MEELFREKAEREAEGDSVGYREHTLHEKIVEVASEVDRLRGELELKEKEIKRLRGFSRRFELLLGENASLTMKAQESEDLRDEN